MADAALAAAALGGGGLGGAADATAARATNAAIVNRERFIVILLEGAATRRAAGRSLPDGQDLFQRRAGMAARPGREHKLAGHGTARPGPGHRPDRDRGGEGGDDRARRGLLDLG